MVTEKQKCIAEQAIYGDLYFNDGTLLIQSISGIDVYLPMDMAMDVDMVKPILRPMSDLIKEITHKGYNEDKPFIPLVELAKINFLVAFRDTKYFLQNGDCGFGIYFNFKQYRQRERLFFLQIFNNGEMQAFSTDIKSHSDKSNTAKFSIVKAKQLIDLLHIWHFDTRNLITTGEAIDVNTLTKNPYEV